MELRKILTTNRYPKKHKDPNVWVSSIQEWAVLIVIISAFCLGDQVLGFGRYPWLNPFWSVWKQYIENAGSFMVMASLQLCLIYILTFALLSKKNFSMMLEYAANKINFWIVRPDALVRLMLYVVLMAPMAFSFTNIKCAIPHNHYFSWDMAFYNLDRILLLGYSPWEILLPILDHPYIMMFLEYCYIGWFMLIGTFTIYILFHFDQTIRQRYFFNYFLCWIVGGALIATVFSSAGPCYFDYIQGINQTPVDLQIYLNKFRQLSEVLIYPEMQTRLWQAQVDNHYTMFAGVSAFPSLHVAITFVIAHTTYKINRNWGIIAYGYSAIIILSSVILGWHYLSDALGAFIVFYLINKLPLFNNKKAHIPNHQLAPL